MRVAYFDCTAGVAGDMLVAALIDAGGPFGLVRQAVDSLGLGSAVRVTTRRVRRGAFVGTGLSIKIQSDAVRGIAEATSAVRAAGFSDAVTKRCVADLRRLASTEGALHAIPAKRVHLHELSGADTLIDVTSFHLLLEALGIDDVQASPVNVGGGRFAMSHGDFAAPAPATAALLRGVPVFGQETGGELTTPTGALLLTGRASRFGSFPAMRMDTIGHGAGTRDSPRPNLLRCFVGSVDVAAGMTLETVEILETNVDDLNPQLYEEVIDRLAEAGALDVYLVPMVAKRSRPGVIIGVIAPPERASELADVLFMETPTLGVRRSHVERYVLERHADVAKTSFGALQVKVARLPGGGRRTVPEFADLRRLAKERGIPVFELARRVSGELASGDGD